MVVLIPRWRMTCRNQEGVWGLGAVVVVDSELQFNLTNELDGWLFKLRHGRIWWNLMGWGDVREGGLGWRRRYESWVVKKGWRLLSNLQSLCCHMHDAAKSTHNPFPFPSNHPSHIRSFIPIHQFYYNCHYHYLHCVSTSNTSTTIIINNHHHSFQPLRPYNSLQSSPWQISICSHIELLTTYISNTTIVLHSAINIKLSYIYPPSTPNPFSTPLPPLPLPSKPK